MSSRIDAAAARFLRTCRSKVRASKYHLRGLHPSPLSLSLSDLNFERRGIALPGSPARLPKKAHEREKENCEGRALTLEQVPVVVVRGQRRCLIGLLFQVEHPAGLLLRSPRLSFPRCSGSPISSPRRASHGARPLASPPFFFFYLYSLIRYLSGRVELANSSIVARDA